VIESPALTPTSKAATKSYGFSGRNSRPPKIAESGASSVVMVFHEYRERLVQPAVFIRRRKATPNYFCSWECPPFAKSAKDGPPGLPSVEGVVGLGGFDFSGYN